MRIRSRAPSKSSFLFKRTRFISSIIFNILCFIGVVFGLIPFAIGGINLYRNGIETSATVIYSKTVTETKTDSDGNTTTSESCEYEYKFKVDGKEYGKKLKDYGECDRTNIKGSGIKVIYDPDYPTANNRPSNIIKNIFIQILFIIFLPLVTIGMLLSSIAKAKKLHLLYMEGTDTKAKVNRIKVTTVADRIPIRAYIEYTFNLGNEKQYTATTEQLPVNDIKHLVADNCNKLNEKVGKNQSYPILDYSDLKPDCEINIVYNPKNPKESAWLEEIIDED